jgi:hypothetical protein
VLGPNEYGVLEAVLGVLAVTGLDARGVRRAVATLSSVVRGAARTVAESRQAVRATGLTEAQWWHGRAGALPEVAPGFAERFPRVAWLDAEGAPDVEEAAGAAACPGGGPEGGVSYLEQAAREAFEGGLELVLDGIEAAIARSAAREG